MSVGDILVCSLKQPPYVASEILAKSMHRPYPLPPLPRKTKCSKQSILVSAGAQIVRKSALECKTTLFHNNRGKVSIKTDQLHINP